MLVCLAGLLSGCLADTHTIRRDELARLAATAEAERGREVRVTQRFVSQDAPPAAPVVGVHTAVVVATPVGGPRRVGRGGQPSGAQVSADSAKWAFVVAALAGVGLAASEGARYDGWVALHPMHPVHLVGHDGSYTWVPLAQLTPAHVGWASEAIVREGEGPWTRLGRAPLDRVGFTYQVAAGAGRLETFGASSSSPYGFLSRIAFGGFPLQELGILAAVSLGWGEQNGDAVFLARYGLELEGFPLVLGRRFHLGVYGQAGMSHAKADTRFGTEEAWDPYYGGGLLAEVDLMTRLALTLRAGAAAVLDPDAPSVLPEVLVGIAVY